MNQRRLECPRQSRQRLLGVEGLEVVSPELVELPSRPGPALHPLSETAMIVLVHETEYSTVPKARPGPAFCRETVEFRWSIPYHLPILVAFFGSLLGL